MEPLTITGAVLGLLVACFFIFAEKTLDKILNPLLNLIGLNSSCGPLEIRAEKKDASIILVIENLGKSNARLASMQGKSANGKAFHPIPYTTLDDSNQDLGGKKMSDLRKKFIKEKITPKSSKTIYLKQSECADCSLDQLELLDAFGGKWPVISGE